MPIKFSLVFLSMDRHRHLIGVGQRHVEAHISHLKWAGFRTLGDISVAREVHITCKRTQASPGGERRPDSRLKPKSQMGHAHAGRAGPKCLYPRGGEEVSKSRCPRSLRLAFLCGRDGLRMQTARGSNAKIQYEPN